MCAKLKIGIVLPTRGDRESFLSLAKSYIERQTLQPDIVEIVDYKPKSEKIDITQRYRVGFERIYKKVDVIFFWEDDDWYAPDYIEWMVKQWKLAGRPELFGVGETYMYHIQKLFKAYRHGKRAAMYNTMVSSKMKIAWKKDDYRFMDIALWSLNREKGKTIRFTDGVKSVGIKHGIGVVGSYCHRRNKHQWDLLGSDAVKALKKLINQDSKHYVNI